MDGPTRIDVPPTRVRPRGPRPPLIVAGAFLVVASVVGLGVLGRTSRSIGPTASVAASDAAVVLRESQSVDLQPTRQVASLGPARHPLDPAVAPTSPRALLAVSATDVWVGDDAGLWQRTAGGLWTHVAVGILGHSPVFDIAASPSGALAVATSTGAAVLTAGSWRVLSRERTRQVRFGPDGRVYVAAVAPGDGTLTATVLARDPSREEVTTYPGVLVSTTPSLGVGPGGEPWVGTGAYLGSLQEFDGRRWVRVDPLHGAFPPNVAGMAVGPDGDLWAALYIPRGLRWSWAVARYDGSHWTVVHPSASVQAAGVLAPNGVSVARDGSAWVPTEWGLLRLVDGSWTTFLAGQRVDAVSAAADGSIWTLASGSVRELSGF